VEAREVVLSGTLASSGDATLTLEIAHPIASPTQIWVPHLTPEPGYVMGDAMFRAPAIVLADGTRAMAWLPDLDDVAHADGFRVWLDYDHPRRTVTLAAGAYRVEGHVFYVRTELAGAGQPVRVRLHVLESTDPADVENPYGMAARFLWDRWGRPGLGAPRDLSPLMDHVVRWAFASGWTESVWQAVKLPGGEAGAPVFIVDVSRHPSVPPEKRTWREPRSIWNQAWFSTQRCANGLLRHAKQTGSADLEARARAMTEIALSAPQTDGLFPAVLRADDHGWHWTSSDRRAADTSAEACHLVDAAFTCRMLLEWHALTGDARARAYVDRFAERLRRLQRPSGAFPGWVEPNGGVPPTLAEGPESAMAVSLLFDLGLDEPATAALPFLENVAAAGRWEDFETYYSCAPWGTPGQKVDRNGVYKQNTLSMAWCAEAFLRGYRATQNAHYLRLARRCVDELSLYQAVWSPPFLPAPGHGGFGVMNADSEWNDARQSLFALLYFDIAREMKDAELIERGVAAVRASFTMLYAPENPGLKAAYEARYPFFGPESYGFMMENQGHGGADPIGTFTIFTWGNGSALATAATVRDLYPGEIAKACGLE
jgi:hypothetical protein